MFDRDKWDEIFQVLSHNMLRTIATAFGVMWGLFMLILMLGAGKGLHNGLVRNFTMVTNSMFLWTQPTSKPYAGYKEGRYFQLHLDDIAYIKRQLPGVDKVCPNLTLGGYRGSNTVTNGLKTGSFQTSGTTPEIFAIQSIHLNRGRYLNENDIANATKSVVIGNWIYQSLFNPGENPIGKYIKVSGVNFQVVGVFGSNSTGDQAQNEESTLYIPITTFQRAFNVGGGVIGSFTITSKPGYSMVNLEEQVKDQLKSKYKIAPNDQRAFGSYNVERQSKEYQNIFLGMDVLSWFVGVFTLIAGIIGVSNIMLVVIKERTNEFGLRRALGATPANIIGQIMMESVTLTSIAGFLGIVLGVWTLAWVSNLIGNSPNSTFVEPSVNFYVVLVSFFVLIFFGLLAGLIPGFRAVSVKPVDALRDE